MTNTVRAVGLGKRYRLVRDTSHALSHGHLQPPSTLVEEITRSSASWVRRLRGGPRAVTDHDFWALRNVGFEIPQGEAVGLIGRNGSGKSTLLKILSRVTHPTEGSVGLVGRVASLLEVGTGFHPDLSARQNIFLNGAILGMRRREITSRLDQIVAFAGVEQFLDDPVKHLSSGLYMRLAFAIAAFLESEILLVDEVLAVGDAAFQEKCLRTMREAANGGRTVIFVSHNMSAVSQLTARTIVLDKGRVAFDGPTPAAVQHYVSEKKQQVFAGRCPTDQIQCQRRYRAGDSIVVREMGLSASQHSTIPTGGTVRMEFLIEAKGPYDGVRIGYTINSVTGQPLVTGLSPLFTVQPGRQLLELVIEQINLIPGEYDFSITLGIGHWGDPKSEYDSYTGFGRLTLAAIMGTAGVFGTWHSLWGPVFHQASTVRMLTSPS